MANTQFIPHLHAFRGFAILTIVAAHAWSFPIFWTGQLDSNGLTWLFQITETLFHGSTLYFAIISGLLFSKVLKSKHWGLFFKGKVQNVLLPFVIMTLLMTALNWQYALEQAPANLHPALQFILTTLHNLITGQAMIHFWYIPVLAFLFAMTPALAFLQNKATWAIVIVMLLPLVISRSPFPDFLRPQSFVFFLGAYALGMFIGEHYQQCQQWINKHKLAISAVAVFTSVLLLCLFYWGYQASSFYSVKQTVVYVQKVALCLLCLHWFAQKETKLPNWLMTLGSYSFAIYFLHVFFMWPFIVVSNTLLTEYRVAPVVGILGSLNLITAILASMAATWLIKRLTGRYSRQIIGA